MKAEILSVGSELMAGRIADTNAAFLSDSLTLLGFEVTRHTAIGDTQAEIVATIREIAPRARVAVVTGGIGPTPDDLTRQAFAEACGAEMTQDAGALANLERLFAARGAKPSPSNLIQSFIPKGADVIQNPRGTAAGFAVTIQGCRFFSLPGVPSEMKVMYQQSVEPELRGMTDATTVVRSLHCFGVGESLIGERLADVMAEGHNPDVATQARDGVITIRATSTAADPVTAQRRLDEVVALIRERMSDAIFGEEDCTLAGAVARLLEKHSLALAVAESCTGGEITAALTDVPGISRFLVESAVTYSNGAKTRRLGVPKTLIEKYGAVSREVAEAMAQGMRLTSGSDVALSITGIAGPSGATPTKPVGLVYIGFADGRNVHVEEARLNGDRRQIKDRAAKRALNALRLHLQGWKA